MRGVDQTLRLRSGQGGLRALKVSLNPSTSLRTGPEIEVIEVEAHINDPLFAETVVEVLDRLMQLSVQGERRTL